MDGWGSISPPQSKIPPVQQTLDMLQQPLDRLHHVVADISAAAARLRRSCAARSAPAARVGRRVGRVQASSTVQPRRHRAALGHSRRRARRRDAWRALEHEDPVHEMCTLLAGLAVSPTRSRVAGTSSSAAACSCRFSRPTYSSVASVTSSGPPSAECQSAHSWGVTSITLILYPPSLIVCSLPVGIRKVKGG